MAKNPVSSSPKPVSRRSKPASRLGNPVSRNQVLRGGIGNMPNAPTRGPQPAYPPTKLPGYRNDIVRPNPLRPGSPGSNILNPAGGQGRAVFNGPGRNLRGNITPLPSGGLHPTLAGGNDIRPPGYGPNRLPGGMQPTTVGGMRNDIRPGFMGANRRPGGMQPRLVSPGRRMQLTPNLLQAMAARRLGG